MTDIELWTRILKGDKVAFEELYHRYYSSLFGYALRLNFDEETIKDCLQDMFVKIYVSHSSLPTLSYVKSYLYRTLLNALLDSSKAARNRSLPLDEYVDISRREPLAKREAFPHCQGPHLRGGCLRSRLGEFLYLLLMAAYSGGSAPSTLPPPSAASCFLIRV